MVRAGRWGGGRTQEGTLEERWLRAAKTTMGGATGVT